MPSKTSGNPVDWLIAMTDAVVAGSALEVRAFAQSLQLADLPSVPLPLELDEQRLAIAAGLIDLLAERSGQAAPDWTRSISPLVEPYFLLRSATSMPHLQAACLSESPAALKRRNLFAPADYLSFV